MARSQSIDLNILPERYRARSLTSRQVLMGLVVVTLLFGLALAFMALSARQAQTAAQRDQLAVIKASLAQSMIDQNALLDLQQQIDQTRAETGRLRAEMRTINVGQPSRAANIAIAIAAIKPLIEVTRISQSGSTYAVGGRAGSQALVLDYARALQSAAAWRVVRIVSMVNIDPHGLAPDVQFVIEMAQ